MQGNCDQNCSRIAIRIAGSVIRLADNQRQNRSTSRSCGECGVALIRVPYTCVLSPTQHSWCEAQGGACSGLRCWVWCFLESFLSEFFRLFHAFMHLRATRDRQTATGARHFFAPRAPGHMPSAHQRWAGSTPPSGSRPPQARRTAGASAARQPRRQICARDHEGSWQHGAKRGWATWRTRTQDEPAAAPRAASASPRHGRRLEDRHRTQRAKKPSTLVPARRRAQRGVSWAGLIRNAEGWRVVGGRFTVCM